MMHATSQSPFHPSPLIAETFIEVGATQIHLNQLIIQQINKILHPILQLLNRSPTPAMAADLTSVLIGYGLALCENYRSWHESLQPKEMIAEATLKNSGVLSNAYGAPIVSGLTNRLDLTVSVPSATPPLGGEASRPPYWRNGAWLDLVTVTNALADRGWTTTYHEALVNDKPAEARAMGAMRVSCWLTEHPEICADINVSQTEAEPYVLWVHRTRPDQLSETLIPTSSMTGRTTGPSISRSRVVG